MDDYFINTMNYFHKYFVEFLFLEQQLKLKLINLENEWNEILVDTKKLKRFVLSAEIHYFEFIF